MEAVGALHLASQKYAESLELHPRNPQALNNWGLVLQVGGACRTASKHVHQALSCSPEQPGHQLGHIWLRVCCVVCCWALPWR